MSHARKVDPAETMPLSELETSGAKVVARLRAGGQPVVLTENGEPSVVLLTAAQFEQLSDRKDFVTEVHQGLADVEAGRTMTTEELKARLGKRFGSPA
jgi:prevent-host-death family protein